MKFSTTSLTFLLFNLMVSENRVYKNLKDINLKKKKTENDCDEMKGK